MAERLPLKTRVGYGVCDLGGNLFFTMMGFYLLSFLTDVAGLAAALAGTALMIGKSWDAITDPLVGLVSDRTRSRWGRRRPYMFWGAFGLCLTMFLMFKTPGFSGQGALFLWAALVYCLLNTAYTLVNIPYGALLPELTTDFDERTAVNGYRMSFAVVGTLVGATTVLPLVRAFARPEAGWAVAGGVMGAVMAATALVTVFSVKERGGQAQAGGTFRDFADALRDRVFLLALLPWVFHIAGVTVIQSALLYYFRYIFQAEDRFPLALLALLATALLFVPVWVLVSRRIGKAPSYNLGMGLLAAAVLAFFVFGERGGVRLAYAVMAVAGVGLATNYVMPWAIIPDVVEHDYAETGRRREGIYYGLWTFASKLGQALAVALNGWLLAAFGYRPHAVQDAAARLGIRLLCGPLPALFFAAGIAVLSFYPIDRRFYEQMLAEIERREKRASDGAG